MLYVMKFRTDISCTTVRTPFNSLAFALIIEQQAENIFQNLRMGPPGSKGR